MKSNPKKDGKRNGNITDGNISHIAANFSLKPSATNFQELERGGVMNECAWLMCLANVRRQKSLKPCVAAKTTARRLAISPGVCSIINFAQVGSGEVSVDLRGHEALMA